MYCRLVACLDPKQEIPSLPFSKRRWALPISFRPYQTETGCARRGTDYKKKTELAREMVDQVAQWMPDC